MVRRDSYFKQTLLDRIDIQVEVSAVAYGELSGIDLDFDLEGLNAVNGSGENFGKHRETLAKSAGSGQSTSFKGDF